MGSKAAQAVRLRRARTRRRVSALVQGAGGPAGEVAVLRRRLVREARRALRTRATAHRAVGTAEVAAGVALRQLVCAGVPLVSAAVLVGLSRGAARRMVALADAQRESAASSGSTTGADGAGAGLAFGLSETAGGARR